jgi:A/G-specific adenine glycosylase
LLFQEGASRPLLDVNMARVIERFLRPRRLADIRQDPWLQAAAHWYARGLRSADANWAMLDFAALVCKVRKPHCDFCAVRTRCSFFKASKGKLPQRSKMSV